MHDPRPRLDARPTGRTRGPGKRHRDRDDRSGFESVAIAQLQPAAELEPSALIESAAQFPPAELRAAELSAT